ncbi:hypothetical protein M0R45_009403 [Rubus argutus]|uniref:Staygreen protein domain-containing protein n=1 Tax=Rubus argutus TaxID=59490 RepID=A0AAW1Y4J1_RUBAR
MHLPWPVIVLIIHFPTITIEEFQDNEPSSCFFKKTQFCFAFCHQPEYTYSTFVSEAARLLGPARFYAAKLKVEFMGEEMNSYVGIIPRTYILSHCDLTVNLTLTISNVINLEQLKGWYSKDDVAEWEKVNGEMCTYPYVSSPNLMLDLAVEFRYHIFSKEMSISSMILIVDRIECWGPLKDAVEEWPRDHTQGVTAIAIYPLLVQFLIIHQNCLRVA